MCFPYTHTRIYKFDESKVCFVTTARVFVIIPKFSICKVFFFFFFDTYLVVTSQTPGFKLLEFTSLLNVTGDVGHKNIKEDCVLKGRNAPNYVTSVAWCEEWDAVAKRTTHFEPFRRAAFLACRRENRRTAKHRAISSSLLTFRHRASSI
jgi:hypothetical protein